MMLESQMRLFWVWLLCSCGKPDKLEKLVDLACDCATPDCSDAATRDLDAWIDSPDRATGDRDSADRQLVRLRECTRRFENARRDAPTKVQLPRLQEGERIAIGRLSIAAPGGYAQTGNRFLADGPVEWIITRSEPADSTWLDNNWPAAIATYRDVKVEPDRRVAAGGWSITIRYASASDQFDHALVIAVIAAHRDGHVYPSFLEAPAPFRAEQRAVIEKAIASFEVVPE